MWLALGTKGGLVSAGYGDDDISRVEEVDELDEEEESSSPLVSNKSEGTLPKISPPCCLQILYCAFHAFLLM